MKPAPLLLSSYNNKFCLLHPRRISSPTSHPDLRKKQLCKQSIRQGLFKKKKKRRRRKKYCFGPSSLLMSLHKSNCEAVSLLTLQPLVTVEVVDEAGRQYQEVPGIDLQCLFLEAGFPPSSDLIVCSFPPLPISPPWDQIAICFTSHSSTTDPQHTTSGTKASLT